MSPDRGSSGAQIINRPMNYLPLLFLPRVGMGELLVILVVVLILFGAKRIPELMHSFGKGIKSFKDGLNEDLTDPKDDDSSREEK